MEPNYRIDFVEEAGNIAMTFRTYTTTNADAKRIAQLMLSGANRLTFLGLAILERAESCDDGEWIVCEWIVCERF